ncbi:MAG: hypothetical protein PVF54_00195 [Anaerolineae bacterium]|jgi:hypothetical protein
MASEQPTEAGSAENAWSELGGQFEALGESLARAVRAAWQDEATRRSVHSLREGLEQMVAKVDQAVRETAESGHGRRLRAEAQRTTESVRAAGREAWRDARPHLLSALTTVNSELEKAIERLEEQQTSSESPASDT